MSYSTITFDATGAYLFDSDAPPSAAEVAAGAWLFDDADPTSLLQFLPDDEDCSGSSNSTLLPQARAHNNTSATIHDDEEDGHDVSGWDDYGACLFDEAPTWDDHGATLFDSADAFSALTEAPRPPAATAAARLQARPTCESESDDDSCGFNLFGSDSDDDDDDSDSDSAEYGADLFDVGPDFDDHGADVFGSDGFFDALPEAKWVPTPAPRDAAKERRRKEYAARMDEERRRRLVSRHETHAPTMAHTSAEVGCAAVLLLNSLLSRGMVSHCSGDAQFATKHLDGPGVGAKGKSPKNISACVPNPCAVRRSDGQGCNALRRFEAGLRECGYDSLTDLMLAAPAEDGAPRFVMAFHGTRRGNMGSILCNGFDPARRSGQAYGRGEYFDLNMQTSMSSYAAEGCVIVTIVIYDSRWCSVKNNHYLIVDNPHKRDGKVVGNDVSYCLPMFVMGKAAQEVVKIPHAFKGLHTVAAGGHLQHKTEGKGKGKLPPVAKAAPAPAEASVPVPPVSALVAPTVQGGCCAQCGAAPPSATPAPAPAPAPALVSAVVVTPAPVVVDPTPKMPPPSELAPALPYRNKGPGWSAAPLLRPFGPIVWASKWIGGIVMDATVLCVLVSFLAAALLLVAVLFGCLLSPEVTSTVVRTAANGTVNAVQYAVFTVM